MKKLNFDLKKGVNQFLLDEADVDDSEGDDDWDDTYDDLPRDERDLAEKYQHDLEQDEESNRHRGENSFKLQK